MRNRRTVYQTIYFSPDRCLAICSSSVIPEDPEVNQGEHMTHGAKIHEQLYKKSKQIAISLPPTVVDESTNTVGGGLLVFLLNIASGGPRNRCGNLRVAMPPKFRPDPISRCRVVAKKYLGEILFSICAMFANSAKNDSSNLGFSVELDVMEGWKSYGRLVGKMSTTPDVHMSSAVTKKPTVHIVECFNSPAKTTSPRPAVSAMPQQHLFVDVCKC